MGELDDAKQKIKDAATEAIGVATIWFKRVRLVYDILSVVGLITLGIFLYVNHKSSMKDRAEISKLQQDQRQTLNRITILQNASKVIEYRIQTNLIVVEAARREISETETNFRGHGSNWRAALREYTNVSK